MNDMQDAMRRSLTRLGLTSEYMSNLAAISFGQAILVADMHGITAYSDDKTKFASWRDLNDMEMGGHIFAKWVARESGIAPEGL